MKSLARENSPSIKKCAFCKYYYDPVNEVISPKRGQKGIWEFEVNVRKPCKQLSNMDVHSQNACNRFECKI